MASEDSQMGTQEREQAIYIHIYIYIYVCVCVYTKGIQTKVGKEVDA